MFLRKHKMLLNSCFNAFWGWVFLRNTIVFPFFRTFPVKNMYLPNFSGDFRLLPSEKECVTKVPTILYMHKNIRSQCVKILIYHGYINRAFTVIHFSFVRLYHRNIYFFKYCLLDHELKLKLNVLNYKFMLS